jgi:hypothetical protein
MSTLATGPFVEATTNVLFTGVIMATESIGRTSTDISPTITVATMPPKVLSLAIGITSQYATTMPLALGTLNSISTLIALDVIVEWLEVTWIKVSEPRIVAHIMPQ